MSIKKKIFFIVSILYVIYTIFPLFADIFHVPVWLPSMVAFFIVLGLYPNAFKNRIVFWFVLYALALGIYVIIGRPLTIGIGTVHDSKKIFIEFAYILPTLSIFSVLSYLNDLSLTKKLVKWSVGLLFASFIITFPLMQRYNSIRNALTEQGEDFRVPGLPSYSLMHAYTLFIPALCYAVKLEKGKEKLIAIIGLAVLCFMVYDTFVTTSLLIMVALVCFALIYNEDKPAVAWILMFVCGLILLILYKVGFFIRFIDWIMPAFEDTQVAFKLQDFRQSMIQGEITGGSITGRQDYHAVSWHSFFQNPIFGTTVVGGHSVIADRLGGMGLFVSFPFIMMIFSFIRAISRMYQSRMAKMFYWSGVVSGFVYMIAKGLWGCESWLMYCVLMPMMIYVLDESKLNDNIDLDSELNNTTI